MNASTPALVTAPLDEKVIGLVTRDQFKSRPSGVVVDAFKRHVADTGSPESFDRISTTRPPATGQLVVLAEFHASKGKRPGGDYVPCPICSPASPQYLHGLLIWCEETAAIYAIGMDCGHKLDREGRLDRAMSAYDRQETLRRLEDTLFEMLPRVPALRAWIAAHLPMATAADRLTRLFRKRVPAVYKLVKQAFDRNGDLPVRQMPGDENLPEPIRLVGKDFLKASFGAEAELRRIDEMLFPLDNGEDALACIETIGRMPEVQRVLAVKFLGDAARRVAKVFAFLDDCADFVSPENMARLQLWSETPGAPSRLRAYADGRRVSVYVYRTQSGWSDTLDGLAKTTPPPLLNAGC